ncbi:MAG: hypothetical protein LBH74_01240 [Nitrososphaerota archaeon]|nr:hypothetical protein [Nitrososphaerota archaeon]
MVENEIELVNAVNNAIEPTIITLARDIILTGALIIPDNKDITLTSNNNAKFFKLIRADSCNTIIVDKGGTLKLDGIIITHNAGSFGTGITVNSGGQLTMIDGEISGNNGGNGYGDVYVVGPL